MILIYNQGTIFRAMFALMCPVWEEHTGFTQKGPTPVRYSMSCTWVWLNNLHPDVICISACKISEANTKITAHISH